MLLEVSCNLLFTMGKHLCIKEHISVEEMSKRYREAADPVERSQWQIVWLLAKGNKSSLRGGSHWLRLAMDSSYRPTLQ